MSEQSIELQRVVSGPVDTAVGEQGVKLVQFVDAAGAPTGGGAAIPAPPSEPGTYVLQVAVSAEGEPVYAWVAAGA